MIKQLTRRFINSLGYKIERYSSGQMGKYYQSYPTSSLDEQKFINVGAGAFDHPYWKNLDLPSEWYRDVQKDELISVDLTECNRWPVEDESIELVYSSHTIEHIPDEAAKMAFSEAYRILVPGGVFRVACPDADIFYETLCFGKKEYWEWRIPWFEAQGTSFNAVSTEDCLVREVGTKKCQFAPPSDAEKLLPETIQKMLRQLTKKEFLDRITQGLDFEKQYAGYHINWWTAKKVSSYLEDVGFENSFQRSRNESIARPFQDHKHFDTTHPEMSLYVEAIKQPELRVRSRAS